MGHIKVIQSGTQIEVFEYEREVLNRPMFRKKKKKRTLGMLLMNRVRKDNLNTRLSAFRRLITANLNDENCYFITLTIHEVCSLDVSYCYLRRFVSLVRRTYAPDFRFVAVPEYQKRGAVHFHVMAWGLPLELIENEAPYWIREEDIGQMVKIQRGNRFLQRCWARGFLDCLVTDGSPKIVGYLSKYMRKSMLDNRTYGKRAFVYSRNCMRPVSLSSSTSIDYATKAWDIDLSTSEALHEKEFSTLWLGKGRYRLFDLKTSHQNEN